MTQQQLRAVQFIRPKQTWLETMKISDEEVYNAFKDTFLFRSALLHIAVVDLFTILKKVIGI